MVDLVAMHQRAAASPLRRESLGHHRHRRVEGVRGRARDTATRGGPARTARPRRIRRTRSPRRSAAPARRAARRAATTRSSSPRRTARSSASVSTRSSRDIGNTRPFGVPATRVARPADALQQRRDAVRRSDLADQIDVADVDAELERRRRDQRLQLAALQPRLGVEPLLLRQAAVMRRDRVLAEPLAQMPRHALGQPPRVDEHERRPVLADEGGEPVVVLLPDLVRHHGFERRTSAARAADRSRAGVLRRRSRSRRARPTRKRATSSMGRCVADRPMRTSGAPATCCRRSSDSARCAPRRVPMTA